MIHPTKRAIPDNVDIIAALVPYKYGDRKKVCVLITNIFTRTITIQPRALLCELQHQKIKDVHQVKIDAPLDDTNDNVDI